MYNANKVNLNDAHSQTIELILAKLMSIGTMEYIVYKYINLIPLYLPILSIVGTVSSFNSHNSYIKYLETEQIININ